MTVTTQAQADRLNRDGEWAQVGPLTAANGHTMMYFVQPKNRQLEPYRVGDDIKYSTWDARCADSCGACRDGEALPDW
jgi:hypothetical protein